MRHGRLGSLCAIFAAMLVLSSSSAFGQSDVETSEQITLSEDLANNPVAQDILKKIEQTKKWIAELEQRNYEQLEAQKELEAKRADALAKLNQDLAEWEKLWEYYSPRNAYGRFVDKIPEEQVKGVFWDQFEFQEMKVKAGKEALKKTLENGGSMAEARQAFHKAAETKRIELIEANSIFNVKHNLAYYNQQVLFDKEGQLVDTPITGEQLRKYYEDYRTNPAYLAANPDDSISWDDMGKTNPDTECRQGQVVVYRFHANDYVCVTMHTAEMWIRHGMGEISGNSTATTSPDYSVTPLTKCDDGFTVIYTINTKKYSCVLAETADSWITQGLAEFHDPETYILEQIQNKENISTVHVINKKIQELEDELGIKQAELKNNYDKKYAEALAKSTRDEKAAIEDYNTRPGMTKEELSIKIMKIRKQHASTQDDILQEKLAALQALEMAHQKKVKDYVSEFDQDPYVKIVWNSAHSRYEAMPRN